VTDIPGSCSAIGYFSTPPAGVRYAWQGFPPVALFTEEGLPATPFCHPPVDLKRMQEGK
jgi:hypothetical protein